MTLQQSLRAVAVTLLIAIFAGGGSSAYAQVASNVPAGIQLSKDLGLADPAAEINITVHLKLNDKAAFDKAVNALYDHASPTFHKWMTNADLKKYAPTQAQQQIVRQELQNHGLTILSTDAAGFTIRAHGTIANVESAFHTEIHQFQHNGRSFRANVKNAQLSGEAGRYVSTVAGLESHQVRPLYVRAQDPKTQKPYAPVALTKAATATGFPPVSSPECLSAPQTYSLQGDSALPTAVYTGTVFAPSVTNLICDYLPSQLQNALGLTDVYAAGLNGKGQTIVLVEAFGYPTLEKDANAFFKLAGLPLLNKSNFSIVYPEGKPASPNAGILTGWNLEMALDLQWSHTIAPGAKIVVVVAAGQDSEDFQNAIAYIADNQLGNQASNSYEEDTDIVAGPLEQTSWDEAIEVATAKGISVNFSTGDSGDEGLGTPVGAAGVPSVSPHATAVGGTSILNDVNNPGSTITTAWGDQFVVLMDYLIVLSNPPSAALTVWDPPLYAGFFGGGGGGESIFFPKPSWQASLPGKGRQTPDVSALADDITGVPIVITFDKQQYLEFGIGGTSLASPIFTGFWAIANEKAGWSLGQAAPAIAALPYGGVQDVLSTTDQTRNNVTGAITDENGVTNYSASEIFTGALYGNKGFTSAMYSIPGTAAVYGFGLDSSFTVKKGWDNATGWGTPYGLAFIDAVVANAK
jgi:subtilase family serine protease